MTSRALLLVLLLCAPLRAQNLDEVLKSLLAKVNEMGATVSLIKGDMSQLKDQVSRIENQLEGVQKNQSAGGATQLTEFGKISTQLGSLMTRVSGIETSTKKEVDELRVHVLIAKTNAAQGKALAAQCSKTSDVATVGIAVKALQTIANQSLSLATQCSSKTDVAQVSTSVTTLQDTAKQSLLYLTKVQKCCENNSKKQEVQEIKVLGALGVIQGLQRRALTTPASTTMSPSTPVAPQSCGVNESKIIELQKGVTAISKRVSSIDDAHKTTALLVNKILVKINEIDSVKAFAGQCSSKTEVKTLQAVANQSLLEMQTSRQSCEANSKLLVSVSSALSAIQRQALVTPAPTWPPRTTTPKPTPRPTPKPGYPTDCADALSRGFTSKGRILLQPAGSQPISAYCDAGWTVIQRRADGDTTFDRPFANYETGFGNPIKDHWIGLKTLHLMTKSHSCNLLAEFYLDDGAYGHSNNYRSYPQDGDRQKKTMEIHHFVVGDSTNQYQVSLSGITTSLKHPSAVLFESRSDNAKFSSKDTGLVTNCAQALKGGWWYPNRNDCGYSNFNGNYHGRLSTGFLSSANRCSSTNKICAWLNPYALRWVELKLKC